MHHFRRDCWPTSWSALCAFWILSCRSLVREPLLGLIFVSFLCPRGLMFSDKIYDNFRRFFTQCRYLSCKPPISITSKKKRKKLCGFGAEYPRLRKTSKCLCVSLLVSPSLWYSVINWQLLGVSRHLAEIAGVSLLWTLALRWKARNGQKVVRNKVLP